MGVKINPLSTLPSKNSTSAAWIEWHKSLKRNFGERTANATWVKCWEKRKSNSANDGSLRKYMKDEGVVINADNILEDLGDSVGSVFGFIGDVFKIGVVGAGIFVGVITLAGVAIVYQALKPSKNGGGGTGTAEKLLMLRGIKK